MITNQVLYQLSYAGYLRRRRLHRVSGIGKRVGGLFDQPTTPFIEADGGGVG